MNALQSRINNSDITQFANAYADWVTANASTEQKPFCAMALPVALQTFGGFKDCPTVAKLETSLAMLGTVLATVGAPTINIVTEDCKAIKIAKDTAVLSDYANVYRVDIPKPDDSPTIELPEAKALKTALSKVKHVNALLLDSIVDSIVDAHKPKAVDDTLYFVEYEYKGKAQSAIVAASNLQSLGDKVGDKVK